MPLSSQLKHQHLLWRAGFGPQTVDSHVQTTGNATDWYKQLTSASSGQFKELDVTDPYLKALVQDPEARRTMSEDERRMLRRKSREDLRKLNVTWLNEMVNSENQLQEKMSLFWHGHFACRSQNNIHQQLLVNSIRKNALGNFGDLLREVSKSAAMLNFLNNNQNRKGHPNENFAREVMELFTIGRGNYTEKDVKEAARAFTGWGANPNGAFIFRKAVHDDGAKTLFSKTGNFDGDQVLNMLLERKETAAFITEKIYRFFVNDEPDKKNISWLSGRFFAGNYNIASLMKDIFTSDWFYEEKNIGTRIKSPVELLVGIRRMLPMEFENEEIQLLIQRVLGQLLFYPPNVAGWPGGKNWIDSSSLMFRLRIPQLIRDADEIALKPKDDDDQMMGMMDADIPAKKKGGGKKALAGGYQVRANVHWNQFTDQFAEVPGEKLVDTLIAVLMQCPKVVSKKLLNNYADTSSRENYIKTIAVQLMSTPEYQLC
jgi:uncharacterized protein (DUF1800 family)